MSNGLDKKAFEAKKDQEVAQELAEMQSCIKRGVRPELVSMESIKRILSDFVSGKQPASNGGHHCDFDI